MNALAHIVHDLVSSQEPLSPDLLSQLSPAEHAALADLCSLLRQPPANVAALLNEGPDPVVWQILPTSNRKYA